MSRPEPVQVDGKQLVFVEIAAAIYDITFDTDAGRALVTSDLTFEVKEAGYPVFCLNAAHTIDLAASSLTLEGGTGPMKIEVSTVRDPDDDEPERVELRYIAAEQLGAGNYVQVDPGTYTLHLEHTLEPRSFQARRGAMTRQSLRFHSKAQEQVCFSTVMFDYGTKPTSLQRDDAGGEWPVDLQAQFLESFVPCNLEFDRMGATRMTLRVTHPAAREDRHQLFANGAIARTGQDEWSIDFGAGVTASCPWVELMPLVFDQEQKAWVSRATLAPVDVRTSHGTLTALVYRPRDLRVSVTAAEQRLREALGQLACDVGPFPAPAQGVSATQADGSVASGQLLVRLQRHGAVSMEHRCAVRSTLDDLLHELHHCYFARWIGPASGNAGWIDEALAIWYEGHLRGDWDGAALPTLEPMAYGSPYRRSTREHDVAVGLAIVRHLTTRLDLVDYLADFYSHHRAAGIAIDATSLRDAIKGDTSINDGWVDRLFAYANVPV